MIPRIFKQLITKKEKESDGKQYATNPELRYKITSNEWVVIAPKRGSRPEKKVVRDARVVEPIQQCPFEDPQASGNDHPYYWYPTDKPVEEWKIQVLPNKYPALTHEQSHHGVTIVEKGLSRSMQGRGYHDLLLTRSHTNNFCDLSPDMAGEVLRAMQQRYVQIMEDECVRYVSIFQNWGRQAGASVGHPHYQIITLPVIPVDVSRSLEASGQYHKETGQCLHCAIIEQIARDQRELLVYENDHAIAFVPFAATEPFQINIFPKNHLAYFEDAEDAMRQGVAEVLQYVLRLVREHLDDPDYNFFLHTAPAYEKSQFHYYHWHIEVIPVSNISAGFELSTGMQINPVVPERAAMIIRGEKETLNS